MCLSANEGIDGDPDHCSVCLPYVRDADARAGGSQEAGTRDPVDSELKRAISCADNEALVRLVEKSSRATVSRTSFFRPDPLISMFVIAAKDVLFRDRLDSLYRGASEIVGQYAEILEDAESYYDQKVRTVYDNVYGLSLLANSFVSRVKVTHFIEFRDLLQDGPSLNWSDETTGTEATATADTEATATADTEATATAQTEATVSVQTEATATADTEATVTAQTEATATAQTEATATAEDPTVDTTSETTMNSGSDFDVGRPCAPGVEQVVRDSKELESLEKNDAGCSVNVVNPSFRKRKRCEPLTTNSSPGQDAKEAQDAQFAPLSNHALETMQRGIQPLSNLDLEMFEQRLVVTLKAKAVKDPQGDMVTPGFRVSHTLRDTCVCSPQSHHPQQSRRFCQPENTFGASGYDGDLVTACWNHLYHPQDTDMSGKCPPQSHDPELEKYACEEVQKEADNEEWRKWLRN